MSFETVACFPFNNVPIRPALCALKIYFDVVLLIFFVSIPKVSNCDVKVSSLANISLFSILIRFNASKDMMPLS